MSKSLKGRTPWNKGTRGIMGPSPNKGKTWSLDYRIKASLAQTKEKIFSNFRKSETKRLRRSSKWKAWRREVFERDDYTCQFCCKHGIELEPHHIIPVSKNKKLIFVVDNGITLCKKCHNPTKNRESAYIVLCEWINQLKNNSLSLGGD